jgi:integrase
VIVVGCAFHFTASSTRRSRCSSMIPGALLQLAARAALRNQPLPGNGLAPRTVGHIHRLIKRVLGHALEWGVTRSNPAISAEPPRVERTEIEILGPAEIKTLILGLRGKSLYAIALLAVATDMRRGELVALRWQEVDLEKGLVRVERSMEQTRAKGVQPKSPKTKAGRRTVSIPKSIVAEIRAHQKAQLEQRFALGMGRAGDEDLVFARHDGVPLPAQLPDV